MMKKIRIILPFLFLSAALCAQETTRLKVYPVHSIDPGQAAEIIQMMMPSTEGFTIRPVERRLAVTGTDEQHQEVEQMLRELDRPPRNVRIDVQFAQSEGRSERMAGIRPQGPVVIRDGKIHGSFEGILSDRSSTTTGSTTQMLVARDGRSATLRVGETVPHLVWLTEYHSRRHGLLREVHIEWKDIGAFLAFEPEIIGNGPWIRIRLVPELSGRTEDGTSQTIRFTEVSTEVIARDGEPVAIGGFTENEDFYSRFLAGRSSGQTSSVTDITLTPRILE